MPRHHNRAILSTITEQGLDPTKEYVVDKKGLKLSSNELKKLNSQQLTNISNLNQEIKQATLACQIHEEVNIVEEQVVTNKIETTNEIQTTKETKIKKKTKSKTDQET